MINARVKAPGSVENLINEKLGELIKLCKEQVYTDEFKKSDNFDTEETELKTLGIIVSKYCEWEADRLETVTKSAFEDSNWTVDIDYN